MKNNNRKKTFRIATRSVKFSLVIFYAIFTISCDSISDKEDPIIEKEALASKKDQMTLEEIDQMNWENGRISPNLNLDATGTILQYRNLSNTIVDVIPFWGSGALTGADLNIRMDKSSQDGWVVIYNQFVTDMTQTMPVLVLYNKYRGILRWWWWNDNQTLTASDKVSYAFAVGGNSNSLLNFNHEFVKNYNQRYVNPYVTSTVNYAFNSGLAPNNWYYFDTEFSYDPNVKNKPQSNYEFALSIVSSSQSTMNFSGNINGDINGTLNSTGSGLNLSIQNLFSSSQTNNNINGSNVTFNNGSKANSSLDNKFNLNLGGVLTSVLKGEITKLATQGLSLFTSPLATMLSSAVSSKQGSQQSVDLKLSANINLAGTSTSTTPVKNWRSAIPGTARGDLSGFLPFYNEPLGVMNLSSQPIVTFKQVYTSYPPNPNIKEIQYLVSNTPNLVLNPAIANEVSISPPSVRLIYLKSYTGKEYLNGRGNSLNSNNFVNWSTVNNVLGNNWVSFSAPYVLKYDYFSGTPEDKIVVHITWRITPNNGSDPVDIVKMFRPQFVQG